MRSCGGVNQAHRYLCRFGLVVLLVVSGQVARADGVRVSTPIPALGAHTLLVHAQGRGTSPAISSPVATQAHGSSLLVLVGGYASNAAMPTDSYANTWHRVGRGVVYDGYESRFDVRAYIVAAASGGAAHTVSLAKQGSPSGEVSMPFLEIRHAGVLQDAAQNYPKVAAAAPVGKLDHAWRRLVAKSPIAAGSATSGTVTTTGPAMLVAVWWGDAFVYSMTVVPDNGFQVIDSLLELPPDSAVQCAVAVKQVDGPGKYHVTWTGAPAQGAILWLFAFQLAD